MSKFHLYDNGLSSKAVHADIKKAISTFNEATKAEALRALMIDIYKKLEALEEELNDNE